ncbi:MAG: GNAT family N-acetyltransferase, partial [Halieaceae bacterium]|nr:GNAT family N-acetyltransferase [Halieaceae bacterium]
DIPNTVTRSSGYAPTVVGRVTALHASYYANNYGFGAVFESKVATEMSEFLSRIDHPDNEIWSASLAGQIVGSVSIDGQDLGTGKAHLRWFIVDECARGHGVGKRLMSAAMQFVNERQFKETHLWTFKGLEAARSLYEREGFSLIKESTGKQWGTEVLEQKFIRPPLVSRKAGI